MQRFRFPCEVSELITNTFTRAHVRRAHEPRRCDGRVSYGYPLLVAALWSRVWRKTKVRCNFLTAVAECIHSILYNVGTLRQTAKYKLDYVLHDTAMQYFFLSLFYHTVNISPLSFYITLFYTRLFTHLATNSHSALASSDGWGRHTVINILGISILANVFQCTLYILDR